MHRTDRRAAWAVALLLTACSGATEHDEPIEDAGASEDETAPLRDFPLEIGVLDKATGAFGPVSPNETLDIVIGFQGLIFVELALRGPADLPAYLGADVEVVFPERPEFDYGFWQNRVEFDPAADGLRVAPLFWVPFGQDVALINGQRVEVEVRLSDDSWSGEATATFLIEDLDGCLMTATGEMECDEPLD